MMVPVPSDAGFCEASPAEILFRTNLWYVWRSYSDTVSMNHSTVSQMKISEP